MIEKILANLDAEKESHVQRLFDILRIPSISTDPDRKEDVRKGAEWVHRFFQDCGLTSEIIETPGHACVLADTGPVNGAPTILVYGHYDVQPVGDESLWHSPAFEPTIRDGAIYARGAADDKGQALTHMLAVESWKRIAGSVPVPRRAPRSNARVRWMRKRSQLLREITPSLSSPRAASEAGRSRAAPRRYSKTPTDSVTSLAPVATRCSASSCRFTERQISM